MDYPVAPRGASGIVAVQERQLKNALEQNEKLEEALKTADFQIYRLVEIMNVMLGRDGCKFRLTAAGWPDAFEAIDRHMARRNSTYEGIG